MTVVPQGQAGVSRGGSTGSLYDILELILDRGLVIDVFIRVSLVGIEILKIDIRIVVASVDTYLRFAEACNRLDLEAGRKAPTQLTDIMGDAAESSEHGKSNSGAHSKTKGALSGAVEAVTDTLHLGGDSEDEEAEEKRPAPKRERPTRRPTRRREE